MTHTTILKAKVAARNRCNSLLKDYVTKTKAALAPFIGKKIVKKGTGGFVDKIKAEILAAVGELPCNGLTGVWISPHGTYKGYDVRVVIRLSENYDSKEIGRNEHVSQESTIYLAECDNDGVLTNFYENIGLDTYRTNYDEEEIVKARLAIKAAQKVLDEAKSTLPHYFEEYDRY